MAVKGMFPLRISHFLYDVSSSTPHKEISGPGPHTRLGKPCHPPNYETPLVNFYLLLKEKFMDLGSSRNFLGLYRLCSLGTRVSNLLVRCFSRHKVQVPVHVKPQNQFLLVTTVALKATCAGVLALP